MNRYLIAGLMVAVMTSAGLVAAQDGPNQIVEIQKKLVGDVEYYQNKVTTSCLQRIGNVAKYTKSQADQLVNCIEQYYQQATKAWCEQNQQLIDTVARVSSSLSEDFVPEQPTTVEQREEMINLIASAHARISNWYQQLGGMVDALFKAGMLDNVIAGDQIKMLNDSLQKVSTAGKNAIATLSKVGEMSPDECKTIINAAMRDMFQPASRDMGSFEKLLFEARVLQMRNYKVEVSSQQRSMSVTEFRPIAERYVSVFTASFGAIHGQSLNAWANLTPKEN